jgi:hypothetical protein
MRFKEFQTYVLNSMSYQKRLHIVKILRLVNIFRDNTYISKCKKLKYFKLFEKMFNIYSQVFIFSLIFAYLLIYIIYIIFFTIIILFFFI